MRILVVGGDDARDIGPSATSGLCRSLVDAGHEVRVVASSLRPLAQDRPQPAPERGDQRRATLADRAGPVIAHAVNWRPHVIVSLAASLRSAALVAAVARYTGTRSWLHLRELATTASSRPFGRLRPLLAPLETLVLKGFDRVSTASPATIKLLQDRGVEPARTREIRNWRDLSAIVPGDRNSRFRTELGLREEDFVGLLAGPLADPEALDLVCDAAGQLRQSHPQVHLVICDERPAACDAGPNLHFLGPQPEHRRSELLATADFHLLLPPAAPDALPPILGDLFASNRPVVASADPGSCLADEIEDAGLAVAPGDGLSLVAAIGLLAEERALSRILGDNARERALQRWSRHGVVGYWVQELLALAVAESGARPVANRAFAGSPAEPDDVLSR